jgi:hypothetical protein
MLQSKNTKKEKKSNKILSRPFFVLELLLITYAFYYHFQLDNSLIQLTEDYKWIIFFFTGD